MLKIIEIGLKGEQVPRISLSLRNENESPIKKKVTSFVFFSYLPCASLKSMDKIVPFCRLGTGWSVHTNKLNSYQKNDQLSLDEQEQIMRVINRADYLESVEQERIG